MSVQDNLLNEKNIVLEKPVAETEEHNQMCSFNSDEMEDMCYFRQDEACGNMRSFSESDSKRSLNLETQFAKDVRKLSIKCEDERKTEMDGC